jgi:hypothetical protein
MFIRTSPRRLASAFIVASVALAACGSDDSSSEPEETQSVTTDPPTSEPAATDPAVTDPATSEPEGAGAVWQGIEPNTTPMSAEDSAAIDATFQAILDPAGDEIPGLWVGIWSAEDSQYSTA